MPTQINMRKSNSRRIIGTSTAIEKIRRLIQQVAPTNATVLITGETGVGKDVIAQAIHDSSSRKDNPFKAVNCGAFYQDLLQSELFGHEKGAFTGAVNLRRGVFEQADGGTLFLDEVGEMSPEVQVKFLRVLDKQEFTRLGGDKDIKVDVRIVAATNVDLRIAVEQKKFRQDLYYRLNLFRIHVPPLRERREDIPIFVDAFIKELSKQHGKIIDSIAPDALNYLENADWPGNVRELKNAVETAIILAKTEELALQDFPEPENRMLPVLVGDYGTPLAKEIHQQIGEFVPTQIHPREPDTVPAGLESPEDVAIYNTIAGLILSAIRLLAPAALATRNGEVPSLIPDDDTSWMQAVTDMDAEVDSAVILEKALKVISTIIKMLKLPTDAGLVPLPIPDNEQATTPTVVPQAEVVSPKPNIDADAIGRVGMTMAEIEKAAIEKTLTETEGNKTEAAKILGIGVRTLHRKLDTYEREANKMQDTTESGIEN